MIVIFMRYLTLHVQFNEKTSPPGKYRIIFSEMNQIQPFNNIITIPNHHEISTLNWQLQLLHLLANVKFLGARLADK
ncbi:unnamed protein product [Hymenolepis diminuta]|uniref:Uncharacterized protein n=1 Tax=Hymenolepis diminuta TaxID=6216 RepID=A0A564YJU6_HYMDI|nr:unnamed protein product [Hymenolepis diminuta]